jgi:hypothetical protein
MASEDRPSPIHPCPAKASAPCRTREAFANHSPSGDGRVVLGTPPKGGPRPGIQGWRQIKTTTKRAPPLEDFRGRATTLREG